MAWNALRISSELGRGRGWVGMQLPILLGYARGADPAQRGIMDVYLCFRGRGGRRMAGKGSGVFVTPGSDSRGNSNLN